MLERFKFRAWDKNEKIMYDPRILDDSFINDEGFYKSDGFVQTSPYFRNLILMQFTGRLDKSKKEIYEHDIIKYDNGTWNGIGVVRWNNEWSAFAVETCSLAVLDKHVIEIIGNIYQNPELIK